MIKVVKRRVSEKGSKYFFVQWKNIFIIIELIQGASKQGDKDENVSKDHHHLPFHFLIH